MSGKAGVWRAVVDRERCTLCEVCAVRCPPSALTFAVAGGWAVLSFEAARCDGCGGEFACQAVCPEKAVVMKPAGKKPAGRAVLARGKLARCPKCGKGFAPLRKLSVPRQRKGAAGRKDAARLCPPCRQMSLLGGLGS